MIIRDNTPVLTDVLKTHRSIIIRGITPLDGITLPKTPKPHYYNNPRLKYRMFHRTLIQQDYSQSSSTLLAMVRMAVTANGVPMID
jgi:hypothetical protein